jgi:hypothetical protein
MLNKERFISNIIHSLANEYEAIKDAAKINYENKCTLCSSLIRSSQVQMNEVESLTKEYKKVIDKLHLRAKWLISMSPSANTQGELDELFKKIEHSQNHLLSSLKTLQERRLEFKTELSCLETTKQLE